MVGALVAAPVVVSGSCSCVSIGVGGSCSRCHRCLHLWPSPELVAAAAVAIPLIDVIVGVGVGC